jgi:hypothetical protein
MVKKCTNYMMMLFVMALSCTTFAQTPKPNFIFIVVDDLNDGIEALNALPETLTPTSTEFVITGPCLPMLFVRLLYVALREQVF